MNSITVSIIVAVYQAEAYLNRCVDSILSQTFSDFELLLIDDGSTDRSGAICDEYARKDDRIKVIHKSNEGLTLTRKLGIENAQGVYTIHCDPDDWMDNVMIEALYRKAEEETSDIVICDMMMEGGNETCVSSQKIKTFSSSSIISAMYEPVSPSLCNKLIRKTCYLTNISYFPKEVEYAEDLYAMLKLLSQDLRISYVPKAFYHYDKNINENCITKKVSLDSYFKSVNYFDSTMGIHAADAVNRLKCNVLWHAYRKQKETFASYNKLYKDSNSFMLTEGLLHPIHFWHYWVMYFHRIGLTKLGDLIDQLENLYVSFVKIALSQINSLVGKCRRII